MKIFEMCDLMLNVEESDYCKENIMTARHAIREVLDYQSMIDFQRNTEMEIEAKETELEEDIEKHDVFMKNKENDLTIAKRELEIAKKKVKTIEKSLSEARMFHNSLEMQKNDLQLFKEKQKKIGEKILRVVLIHKSAKDMPKKLKEYQLSIIVANSCDYDEYVKNVVRPDVVVEPTKLIPLINQKPYDFDEKYDEKERQSIITYCNLVANVAMNMEDYSSRVRLLYRNEDIAKILKMNGIEI